MATIEINGQKFDVNGSKMIIEVADEAGIHIPRFCYHKKLSVAANCRMCLVQLENSRKTVPACATPITDGMKVFTQSPEAIHSQQVVMDFLLINHPLDCPICDQGGECELQDVSMGYGRGESNYNEEKRAVDDENLGPLIATEMTRCIHCTRCVRFGQEIAGLPELGSIGRGEHTEISTYVEHSMASEISGNIIDLCPVGALTSKPYRYSARAWEMTQAEGVALHDCLGSPLYYHTRRNRLMRVVPREDEALNEVWLSDRDRFSYVGVNAPKRAAMPKIKIKGQWQAVDWQTALQFTADGLLRLIDHYGPQQFAAFASASASVEEFYLLQQLMRHHGIHSVDHRLQQIDFRDDAAQPVMPESTLAYADIEQQDVILLLGCQLVREVPLAGVRLRKAVRAGAQLYVITPAYHDLHVKPTELCLVSPQDLPTQLAKLVVALTDDLSVLPEALQSLLFGFEPDESSQRIAQALKHSKAVVITGALIENHPDAAVLRTLIAWINQLSGAKHVRMTAGANAAGGWVAGMVPHRTVGGLSVDAPGLNVAEALKAKLKGYLLLGVEPEFDFANPYQARQSMLAAEFVVMMTAFEQDSMFEYANVILPMGVYAETSGTYINLNQSWQSVNGALTPPGSARPAWKILRVLGNLTQVPGFEYESSEQVLADVKAQLMPQTECNSELYYPHALPNHYSALVRVGEWPLYRSDALVRHSPPLQACAAADAACIRMHPDTALAYNLTDQVTISQGQIEITLPLVTDSGIAPEVVWVANAMPETIDLGHAFAAITVKS
jgi:NADH-quinone oxidoreductase subunit G